MLLLWIVYSYKSNQNRLHMFKQSGPQFYRFQRKTNWSAKRFFAN